MPFSSAASSQISCNVGSGLAAQFLGVKCGMIDFALPFEQRSDGVPDVTGPSAEDFVAIRFQIDFLSGWNESVVHFLKSFLSGKYYFKKRGILCTA